MDATLALQRTMAPVVASRNEHQKQQQQEECNGKSQNNCGSSSSSLTKDEIDFVAVGDNNGEISSNNNNNTNTNYNKDTCTKKQKHQQNSNKNLTTITDLTTKSAQAPPASKKSTCVEKKKCSTLERLTLFSFSKKIGSQKTHHQQQQQQQKQPQPKNVANVSSSSPTTPLRPHMFVKSASISRLLGNSSTCNAKKQGAKEEAASVAAAQKRKFNTYGGRRRRLSGPYLERFKGDTKDAISSSSRSLSELVMGDGGADVAEGEEDLWIIEREQKARCDGMEHYREPDGSSASDSADVGAKAVRMLLSRSLGRLWWRRTHSVDISTPDSEYKVSYLGNVLTGWAKGEGCVEKQLNTLWRNYTQNSKPDVLMRVRVCASGLKATTRQHGLTEYWANRITHCCAPAGFPRVFCWIYRHEGRKLKHELRCHAVLCSKERSAQDIYVTLKANVESALREFKREKILKQNARLSLANAADDNPSMPRRKILLSVGGNNYRPPLERSKSAPKLMAIEEAIGEEDDGGEVEDTNEPEMRPCCQRDSLYPAMTLGRRHCRRGHSIRRTGKARPTFLLPCGGGDHSVACVQSAADSKCCRVEHCSVGGGAAAIAEEQRVVSSDDSDEFDKLLKHNDYDASTSLATELLPYFDMHLHKSAFSELEVTTAEELEPHSLLPTINSDPNAHPNADYDAHVRDDDVVVEEGDAVRLRSRVVCEEDYLDTENDMYFRQAALLTMLHRHSMRKMAQLSLSSDESSSIETNASLSLSGATPPSHRHQSSILSNASGTLRSVSGRLGGSNSGDSFPLASPGQPMQQQQQQQLLGPTADSDESSISSGCETASTATTNQDDISLTYRHSQSLATIGTSAAGKVLQLSPLSVHDIYHRRESRLDGGHNSDTTSATTFSSSSSITLKMSGQNSPTTSLSGFDETLAAGNNNSNNNGNSISTWQRRARRHRASNNHCSGHKNNSNDNNADSDSECSDESGYVEYQDSEHSPEQQQPKSKSITSSIQQQQQQQQQFVDLQLDLAPKPLPRRLTLPAAVTNNNNSSNNTTAV